MAIIPSARFPTQTTAPDADYPLGGGQDITTPGDDSGTPWEAAVVNDIWGHQQALLAQANIAASGDPETAQASQYMQALNQLYLSTAQSTVSLLTTSIPVDVPGIRTLAYENAGDGGGGTWIRTGSTGPAGTKDFSNGVLFDALGNEFAIDQGQINVRQYGAIGDGAADDTVPIQEAIDTAEGRGGGRVHLPCGVFLCTFQVNLKDKVTLSGEDHGTSVLTFAGAAGAFPDGACVYATGSQEALPALDNDIVAGGQIVRFVSSHGMQVNSLFMIVDPRSFSYAAGNALYEAGEFMVVSQVTDSTNVLIQNPAYATTNPNVNTTVTDYRFASVEARLVTPVRVAIRGIHLVGRAADSTTNVVGVSFGRDCVFERLALTWSGNSMIHLDHCYDCIFEDVLMINASTTGSDNNGIRLEHCQLVFLNRVIGGGSFNMLSVGLGSGDNTIPNRQISVSECFAPQQGTAEGSVQFETNCERVLITDSTLAGLLIGGDQYLISNCLLEGQPSVTPGPRGRGWALIMEGMTGFNVSIDGCRIVARSNVSGDAMVLFEDASPVMYRPATCLISNTTIDLQEHAGAPFLMESTDLSENPSLRLNNVHVIGDNLGSNAFRVRTIASAGWETVDIHDSRLVQCGAIISGVRRLQIATSEFLGSPIDGVNVGNPTTSPFTDRRVLVQGCFVTQSEDAGIEIVDENIEVSVANTVSVNNNQDPTPGTTKAALVFAPSSGTGATKLTLVGNTFGDDQAVLTSNTAYHYSSNVDLVIDSRTTVLGNLVISRNAAISDTIRDAWHEVDDEGLSSGTLGLKRGVPQDAPAGAQDLAIGTGTGNRGIYLKSSTTGESSLVMGDTGDADRMKMVGHHTSSRRITFSVDSTGICDIDTDGVLPRTADNFSVGTATRRWGHLYGGLLHGNRLALDWGTITDETDIGSLVGWGTNPSVSSASTGRDSIMKVVIVSGTGSPGAGATFTYTFADGASGANIPHVILQNGPTSQDVDWEIQGVTATTVDIRIRQTPATTTTYTCIILLVFTDTA